MTDFQVMSPGYLGRVGPLPGAVGPSRLGC